MSLFKWSRTAASNATADSTCPFPEGMAGAALNDGTRGMMAAVAKYVGDISGAIVTGGTSTAYTVTSYQVFDSLAHLDGQMIAFTPHATNGATVTLNVDGLGAKPLRSAPSTELPDGALILGTPYVATYSNTDAVWYLQGGLSNPYNIPLGGGLPYFGSTAPNSSFIFPFGQSISRTTYAALFSLLGTTYGAGDGSTTFNVPDLRGRVIAGKDDMGGVSAARLSALASTTLGGTGGAQTVTLATANLPATSYSLAGSAGSVSVSSTSSSVFLANTGIVGIQNSGFTAGATYFIANGPAFTGATISTGSFTPAGTIGPLGSATPFNTVQPTLVCNYILRVI